METIQCSMCGMQLKTKVHTLDIQWLGGVCPSCHSVYCDNCLFKGKLFGGRNILGEVAEFPPCPTCGKRIFDATGQQLRRAAILF